MKIGVVLKIFQNGQNAFFLEAGHIGKNNQECYADFKM